MAKEYTSLVEMELGFKTQDIISDLMTRKQKIELYRSFCKLEKAEILSLEKSLQALEPKNKAKHEKAIQSQILLKKSLVERYETTVDTYLAESKEIVSSMIDEASRVAANPRAFMLSAIKQVEQGLKDKIYEEKLGYLKEFEGIIQSGMPIKTVVVNKQQDNQGKGKE